MKPLVRAMTSAICLVLMSCSHGPLPDPYVMTGHYKDIKAPVPIAEPLKSCEELALLPAPTTREVYVHVLGFDEIYDGRRIRAALTKDLNFSTLIQVADSPVKRIYVKIPAGFVTDFSSIPSGFAQSIHRTFGKTAIPAIAHDFLYAVGRPGDEVGRLVADNALKGGMVENGSGPFSKGTVYLAVRVFGKSGYGNPKELRFLDLNRTYNPPSQLKRIVVPVDEFNGKEGKDGAVEMYNNYVRICPPRPDDRI